MSISSELMPMVVVVLRWPLVSVPTGSAGGAQLFTTVSRAGPCERPRDVFSDGCISGCR